MADEPTPPKDGEQDEEHSFERFQQFARALFRVDKREVPKHEPKKRTPANGARTPQ